MTPGQRNYSVLKIVSSWTSKKLQIISLNPYFSAYHLDPTCCRWVVNIKRMIPPRTTVFIRIGQKAYLTQDRAIGCFILSAWCRLYHHLYVDILIIVLLSLWCVEINVRTEFVFLISVLQKCSHSEKTIL